MYLDHYNDAPLLLRKRIEILLTKLEVTVTQESNMAFAKIISKNPTLHIYSLGLFYQKNSWDYISPTFSSEEGLQYTAESYAFSSMARFEANKATLRWSACDSPHHDDDTLMYMMPITNILLQEIATTLDVSDPMYKQYEWPDRYVGDYNLFYKFLSQVYQAIQNVVRLGLREVWKMPLLRDFFISNECALTLSAETISNDDFLSHIKRLNTEVIYNKLKEDLVQNTLIQKARGSELNLIPRSRPPFKFN